jgi:hypothetical protein
MTIEKTIDVRDQVTLSFEKSFRFCRKGISYRLFRSSLTLAVVVVAVAFFTVLLSEGLMVRATSGGVAGEMAGAREADALLMHLFHRHSSRELSAGLAAMQGKPVQVTEFARVAGIDEEAANALVSQCCAEQLFLRFFRDLSPGKRVVLVKKSTGRDAFAYLAGREEWEAFVVALEKMRSVRLPASPATLRTFLDGREAYFAALEAARAGRSRTVVAMERKLGALSADNDVAAWLGEASDADIEQWRRVVNESGFDLDRTTMGRVREILKVSALEGRVGRLLQTPEKRALWKEKMQSSPGLEEKFLLLKDERVTEILGGTFTGEQLAAVADRYARMKHLRKLVGKLPSVDMTAVSAPRFLDGRQMFLVLISFLVCMVGITNAMLMSITERFREIATMKCLGATDGFILKQFLIEAAIQGVVGGGAGMIIGMVVSVIKSSVMLGGAIFAHFPAVQMLYCAVFTILVGILLAMLASIYPARAAAHMAPMDAMRVE